MKKFLWSRIFIVITILAASPFCVGCDQGSTEEEDRAATKDGGSEKVERDLEEELVEFDDLACFGIHMCKHCCTAGPCFRACEAAGTPERTADLQAMYDCSGVTCKNECNMFSNEAKCNKCIDTKCSDIIAACDWNPSGNLTCQKLNDCLHTCGSLPSKGSAAACTENEALWCINKCHGNADEDAISKFQSYDQCVWTNCIDICKDQGESYCNLCINENCATEVATCLED